MAILSGTHLGPYEIVSAIGAGGMGEVYRSRDPTPFASNVLSASNRSGGRSSVFRARLAADVLLLVLIFMGPAGCYETERSKERAVARGKALFELNCCGCHNGRRTDLAKMPPNLTGIFRQRYLPSGAPATDAAVRSMMLAPRSDIMPSFEGSRSDQEIEDIIRYLHSVDAETHLCAAARTAIR
jgi:cytochrome c2